MREITYSRHWHILAFILDSVKGKRIDQITKELADSGFDVVERTVRRDLIALRQSGFPIDCKKTPAGTNWQLSANFRNMPPVPFMPIEALALIVAQNSLRLRGDKFLYEQIGQIISKLCRNRSPEFRHDVMSLKNSVYCHPSSRPPKRSDTEIYDKILSAITSKHKLRTNYRNASGQESRERTLAPITLWIDNQQTYLIAYCYKRRDIRVFALARFSKISETSEVFKEEWIFDPKKFASDSIGVFHAAPVDIKLSVDNVLLSYFEIHPLHAGQEIEKHETRSALHMRIGINEALISRIMGFGAMVRVIKPAILANIIRERHRAALASYERSAVSAAAESAQLSLPLYFE